MRIKTLLTFDQLEDWHSLTLLYRHLWSYTNAINAPERTKPLEPWLFSTFDLVLDRFKVLLSDSIIRGDTSLFPDWYKDMVPHFDQASVTLKQLAQTQTQAKKGAHTWTRQPLKQSLRTPSRPAARSSLSLNPAPANQKSSRKQPKN